MRMQNDSHLSYVYMKVNVMKLTCFMVLTDANVCKCEFHDACI